MIDANATAIYTTTHIEATAFSLTPFLITFILTKQLLLIPQMLLFNCTS